MEPHLARGLFNPYSVNGATIVDDVVTSDHSAWILDPVIPDSHAGVTAELYGPLLQTVLGALYSWDPGLVRSISECYYANKEVGTSTEDVACTAKKLWAWTTVAVATVVPR